MQKYYDKLGSNFPPNDSVPNVKGLRRKRSGDVLVELSPGYKNKGQFSDVLCSTRGNSVMVRCVESEAPIVLRDLDEPTIEADVTTAVHTTLERDVEAKAVVSKAK